MKSTAYGILGLGLMALLTSQAEAATPCGAALRKYCGSQRSPAGYRCLARRMKDLSAICREIVEGQVRRR